jgi:hypothetical protein
MAVHDGLGEVCVEADDLVEVGGVAHDEGGRLGIAADLDRLPDE